MVPLSNVSLIFNNNRTDNFLDGLLALYPQPEDQGLVPADLLGSWRVTQISVTCPARDYKLDVDRHAFRSSSNNMISFALINCDSILLDWSFLEGFHQLSDLRVMSSSHVLIKTLPALPGLLSLTIQDSSLNISEEFLPWMISYLREFSLYNTSNSNDQVMDKWMDWLVNSSSSTLDLLWIPANNLTRIPSQVGLFSELNVLVLGDNLLPPLTNGSLSFSVPVNYVSFNNSQIGVVEPGAFQGITGQHQ